MFFETRVGPFPEAPMDYQSVGDLFIGNRPEAAQARIAEIARAGGATVLESASLAVLQIEIFRALGRYRRARALSRLAASRYPTDPALQVYRLRGFLGQGRYLAGFNYLRDEAMELKALHPGIWSGEMAGLQADAGFEMAARRYIDEALASRNEGEAHVIDYLIAWAFSAIRDRARAIEFAESAVLKAPGWARARALLADQYLAIGETARARAQLEPEVRANCVDISLEITAAFVAISEAGIRSGERLLEAIVDRYPEADSILSLKHALFVAATENGNDGLCERLRKDEDLNWPQPEDGGPGESTSVYIPLPLIAQNRDECVPTSVAMITHALGYDFDPSTLYNEMHGRQGVALWRLREWLSERGFTLRPLKLTRENVIQSLDMGAPLLGLIEGFLFSHVDVICGYNRDLGLLYVRDPDSWPTHLQSFEAFAERRQSSPVVYLITDTRLETERGDSIARLEVSDEGSALLDLGVAIDRADNEMAMEAFRRIPEDCWAELPAVGQGARIVVTSKEADAVYSRIAANDQLPTPIRFQALIRRSGLEASKEMDALIEKSELRLSRNGLKVAKLFHAQAAGQTERALSLCESLVNARGATAYFWAVRAELLRRVGRFEEAEISIEYAIELEPLNAGHREQALRMKGARILPETELASLIALSEEDRSNKGLLYLVAQAQASGPDGLLYEATLREYLRHFPRDMDTWAMLAHWFIYQRNGYQARAVAREALIYCPDDEATYFKNLLLPDNSEPEPHAPEREVDAPVTVSDWLGQFADPTSTQREAARQTLTRKMRQGELAWYEEAVFRFQILRQASPSDVFEIGLALSPAPESCRREMVRYMLDLCAQLDSLTPQVARKIWDWLEAQTPDFRADSDGWFHAILILERMGKIEDALKELEQLVDEFPGASSGLYRLGLMRARQQRLRESVDLMQRCLEIDPGLPGAMEALDSLADDLGDSELGVDARRRLAEKYPYSQTNVGARILDLTKHVNEEAAAHFLESVRERFNPIVPTLFDAQMALDRKDYGAARAVLEPLEELEDDELFNEYLGLSLQVAMALEDSPRILTLCDRGLARWPDSAKLLKIKAQHLGDDTSGRVADLYFQSIQTGYSDTRTIYEYLKRSDDPLTAIQRCFEAIEAPNTEPFLEQCIRVFELDEFAESQADFYEWALSVKPDHQRLQFSRVYHRLRQGEVDEAQRFAEALRDQYPDDADCHLLLGEILVDRKPKDALGCFRRACETNESVYALFQYARCLHVLGRQRQAKSRHWRILELDPTYAASVTALYLMEVPARKLWPLVNPILAARIGERDEYFLVVAVHLARARWKKLHSNWFDAATSRFASLQDGSGFRDERERLLAAIESWLSVHPDPDHSLQPKNTWLRFIRWPGSRWIPKVVGAPASEEDEE